MDLVTFLGTTVGEEDGSKVGENAGIWDDWLLIPGPQPLVGSFSEIHFLVAVSQ